MLTPALRKLALTAHVTASLGWWGSIAGFLVLAVTGLTSEEAVLVRAAYVAMDLVARWAILPLSIASLLTGIVESLGTHWGFLRHYWVSVKLLLTVLATVFLLAHLQPIGQAARAAAAADLSKGDLRGLRTQLVADGVAGSLVLLIATVLGVYKPRGMTAYGWRKDQQRRMASP
jgi:hypothetical protein